MDFQNLPALPGVDNGYQETRLLLLPHMSAYSFVEYK